MLSKKHWSKKSFVHKILDPKKFDSEKNIVFVKHFQKKFRSEKIFGPKLFLGSFDYRTYKKIVPKKIRSKEIFGEKNVFGRTIFLGPKKFLVQKNLRQKEI